MIYPCRLFVDSFLGRGEDGRMKEETRQLGLEENFARLEEIIERLEDEEIPLEEAFRTYSEGMAVLKQCGDQLDRVEKQVLKLTEEGTLEEFTDGIADDV